MPEKKSLLKPSMENVRRGIDRYNRKDRPKNESINRIDWFIDWEGSLYPVKYIYGLATNTPPADFNTDQAKRYMRHLNLSMHSLKSGREREQEFRAQVQKSLNDDSGRKLRLLTANPIPKAVYTYSIAFQRNPDVVAEVLKRANGICECCGQSAPFIRASDGSPYLEVHHKVFLADGGPDTVMNAEALCPNCHRRKHHGERVARENKASLQHRSATTGEQ